MSAPLWLQRARVLQRPGMTEARLKLYVGDERIMDLTRPDKDRREYPEVSFAVIGVIARE